MQHALLSASGAHRWMACPGSARLEEQLPETPSVYADEGTLAHKLADLSLTYSLGKITRRTYNTALDEITEDSMYCKDMSGYVEEFVDFVMDRVQTVRKTTSDALCLTEQRLDFSEYVPESFGTGDVIIIADNLLQIVDLKYGQGVPVSAERNSQMMLYALGALHEYGHLYDIDIVNMVIYQPRIDNVSEYSMTVSELLDWAENKLKPAAELAYEGNGGFKSGDHCKFCRAKAVCRERADENLRLVKHAFQSPDLLSDEEIPEVLNKADMLASWVKDIKDYALTQAMKGKKWIGFKLVEGRSVRQYKDELSVANALRAEGYSDEEILKTRLMGIGEMEKAIGKKNFNRILEPAGLIIKPPGKPTLVSEGDSRPEMILTTEAFNDGFEYHNEMKVV